MPDVFTSSQQNNVSNSSSSNDTQKGLREDQKAELLKKEKETQMITIPEGTDIHTLPGHSHNPLAAYNFYPDNVKFVNADSEEKVLLLVRRHPITNLGWIIVAFLMIIAPSFLGLLPFFDKLPSGFQTVMILIWYLITFAFILESFLDWYFNVCIITDERVIDVDFVNLLYREISETKVTQIQDVSVEIGGGIRTFFGYGNVLIQTAAEIENIEFADIPNPDKVSKILRELGIQEEVEEMEGRIR
jgi:membrane protein YdbS with pleckstrin-like domain